MIAVIATVLNEGESIRKLMDSLVIQTRRPDQVVIVDGGSTDQTVAILHDYGDVLPLTVLQVPGANISAGRNAAIAAVSTPAGTDAIIAATDAGVVLDRDWLALLTQPLLDDADCEVSGGFFLADPHTRFEAALGATTLPEVEEINAETFLPSSRSVAFRKSAWARVGGYPEWLDYCEDLIFDLRLKAMAHAFAFAPNAIVHFRPRPTLRAFYKQYYRYARGDGKADLWRKRHAIRYATYLIALPTLLIMGAVVHWGVWGLVIAGGAFYTRIPYRRLPRVLRRAGDEGQITHFKLLDRLYITALIPVIRVVGDVAKMIGYPVGWRWRLQHRPPRWKP